MKTKLCLIFAFFLFTGNKIEAQVTKTQRWALEDVRNGFNIGLPQYIQKIHTLRKEIDREITSPDGSGKEVLLLAWKQITGYQFYSDDMITKSGQYYILAPKQRNLPQEIATALCHIAVKTNDHALWVQINEFKLQNYGLYFLADLAKKEATGAKEKTITASP